MADPASAIELVGSLTALVFTFAGAVGVAYAVFRSRATAATVTIWQDLATARQAEVTELRERVAKLEGIVTVLEGDFAERIVAAITTTITLKGGNQ